MELANNLRMQKYNVEEFVLKNSFFNKSREEIVMIYNALKDPENNQMYLDALGLTDVNELYRKQIKKEQYYKKALCRKDLNQFL